MYRQLLPSNVETIPTIPEPAPSSMTFFLSRSTFPASKYSQRTMACKARTMVRVSLENEECMCIALAYSRIQYSLPCKM